MRDDELNINFTNKAKMCRDHIFSKIKPLAINNMELNGESLCSFVESILQQTNEGELNIEDMYVYVCRQKCVQAVEKSFEIFKNEFTRRKLPCDDREL